MKHPPSGELELIQSIRKKSAAAAATAPAVRLGIGDDCAILRPPPGHDVLVTTDFSLEGRHFRRDWHPPASAGHRCLARGLSDLAAMGATPLSAFLSLALPENLRSTAAGRRWLDGFFQGLLRLAEITKTPLSGGDTATAPGDAILADIVLVGSAPRGRALLRRAARPGDLLYVTGALGGAAAQLRSLAENPSHFRRASVDGSHPHLFPSPRLAAGQALLRRGLATAAIDLSDGLSTDLRHLCHESNVGATVQADRLPLHPLATARHSTASAALDLALHGGEDYELLFTAGSRVRMPRSIAGIPITEIGTITAKKDILLQQEDRRQQLPPGGWQHPL